MFEPALSLSAVCEAIKQRLADPSLHHAVLIDPTLGDPFAVQREVDQLTVYALPLPEEKATPELRPYLLPVCAGDPLLERSIILAQEEAADWHAGAGYARSVCGWLSYTGDIQPLA
ncbi:MAG: hypothetical protein JO067_08895, partial [Cupriavidus sp.]|nr:hypothetical protein [Cupriavidus sp.]